MVTKKQLSTDYGQWQDIIAEAHKDRTRHLIEAIAPDRLCVRPSLTVVAVQPKRRPQHFEAGYPFTVAGADGDTHFVTTRSEVVPPIQLVSEQRVEREQVVADRGAQSGVRLSFENLSDEPVTHLRLFVGNADVLATLLATGEAYITTENGPRPATLSFGGLQDADQLFPQANLGCRGRSLLAAWSLAEASISFVDLSFEEIDNVEFDVAILFREATDANRIPDNVLQIGCVPLRNERIVSENVTIDTTTSMVPVRVPDSELIARVGRIESYAGDGHWKECRPWLGSRHNWGGQDHIEPRYVLDGLWGEMRLKVGLFEPQADLETRGAHLNVRLALASPKAAYVVPGDAATGDLGERAIVVTQASPLMTPMEIDPAELAAETLACGWLSQRSSGDVTDGLVAALNRATMCLQHVGRHPVRLWTSNAAEWIRRATTESKRGKRFPLIKVRVELHGDVEPRRGFLLGAVLEFCLPLFAPRLAGTQLTLINSQGEHSWVPRWPVN